MVLDVEQPIKKFIADYSAFMKELSDSANYRHDQKRLIAFRQSSAGKINKLTPPGCHAETLSTPGKYYDGLIVRALHFPDFAFNPGIMYNRHNLPECLFSGHALVTLKLPKTIEMKPAYADNNLIGYEYLSKHGVIFRPRDGGVYFFGNDSKSHNRKSHIVPILKYPVSKQFWLEGAKLTFDELDGQLNLFLAHLGFE